MTLFNVLNVGVLGLLGQSKKIESISDNVSNVNTVGYKSVLTQFQDLVTANINQQYGYYAGGVTPPTKHLNSSQGDINPTDNTSDIAINGNGYFVVKRASTTTGVDGTVYFTRAGAFSPDELGNLVNGAGFTLQGWPLNANGTAQGSGLSGLKPVNVQNQSSMPVATSSLLLRANLKSDEVAYDATQNPLLVPQGSVTFAGNPAAGDSITLNGIPWTFVSGPAGLNQTTIGANLGATLSQLAADLNATGNININTASFAATATQLNITYRTPTGAGNGYTLGSANANASVSGATLKNPPATSSIAFSANPSNGQTLTLGGTTWTFVTSGAHGNQTNIGANLSATLTQLATDLAASADPGIVVAKFTATPTGLNVAYGTSVLSGQNYTLASGNANSTTSGTALTSTPSQGSIHFNANPNIGDSITLNGTTWTFVSGTAGTNQTSIGADLNTTLVTLAQNLNQSVDNNIKTASYLSSATNLNVTFKTIGATGNNYTLGSSNANATPVRSTLTSTGASGNVTFSNNPLPGETIRINGVAWTFVSSGATGNQTNVGANLSATLAQLATDLSASTNPALSAATYTTGTAQINISYKNNLSIATNPIAGSTIKVGGTVWTFVTSGATGNQTNIGADLNATLTQLTADLNASADAGVSSATYLHTTNSTSVDIYYKTPTAAGSAYSLAIGSADITPATPTLTFPPLTYTATVAGQNMSSGAITPSFTRGVEIIDSTGGAHNVNISFLKTANNTWQVEIYAVPLTDVTSAGGQVANGTMMFNTDGSLASVSPSLLAGINFPWAASGTPAVTPPANNVTFAWGTAGTTATALNDGMTQVAKAYSVVSVTQDGSKASGLKNVEISADGIVSANYNDGTARKLFQIPLAVFINPDAMTSVTGTVFTQSAESKLVDIFGAGKSGAGNLQSGALEASNVELADQLTDIIIAQRAYQSNSKLITTSDDMLKTATQMLN